MPIGRLLSSTRVSPPCPVSAAVMSSERISSSLTHTATHIDAASLLALCLHQQGIRHMFGVIGIPIVEVGTAAQQANLTFLSFRNEQAASYAASVVSYLTGTPAACLTVAGPGVIHALAGVGNAWANRWSMIVISAAVATAAKGSGGFQEAEQLDVVRPFVKHAAVISAVELIPIYVERAVRESMYGRPGPVYLELPTELVLATVEKSNIQWRPPCPPPPRPLAAPESIATALSLLMQASSPLLVLGKGAAYARAETALATFVSLTSIPFLPSPMAKGLLPDSSPLSAAAARSTALAGADVVLVVGARLNWLWHMGGQGRWKAGGKVIQVDICPEELGNGRHIDVPILGHAAAVIEQFNAAIRTKDLSFPPYTAWKAQLSTTTHKNLTTTTTLTSQPTTPLTYYYTLHTLHTLLHPATILVSEGANTMDISRTVLQHEVARSRLDAGTFATMGVGVGYAIAAAIVEQSGGGGGGVGGVGGRRKVVAVEGDSAFGFSAMEYETAVRYRLPITFVVLNNSGVYYGASDEEKQTAQSNPLLLPVTALSFQSRYELLGEMFGGQGRGWRVEKAEELAGVLKEALSWPGPSVVNIIIKTQQGRKAATHSWLSAVGKAKL